MRHLQRRIKAIIHEGDESGYVASCFDLPVVTQAKTHEEEVSNLKEAIELHFDGEDPAEIGYVENPAILIMYEVDTVYNRESL